MNPQKFLNNKVRQMNLKKLSNRYFKKSDITKTKTKHPYWLNPKISKYLITKNSSTMNIKYLTL